MGGMVSRYMSNLVTGGDSSEKLPKEFRRSLSTEAKMEEFSRFSIPDSSHLQIYLRKYPNFRESNIPFHQFEPSEHELEENLLIERRKKEEKEANLRRRKEGKGTNPGRRIGRSIIFQGLPDPSGDSSQNEPGPSGIPHNYEDIEAALAAAEAEEDQESVNGENEDPVILEYIENQIEENNDEEFGIFDDRQIEFVDEDEDENVNDPIFEFVQNDEIDDSQYINLIADLPAKRSRKRPSRFDDFDLN